ncbi:heterokaryon incompatibility protein-domain-containing protein [Annulohypoxylon maeteangense]|uniref:heterokaryon incompatibility protein-domain-containing protein n=1 Tax=Annulohypoxylon maeteangense TaxID=1927788 RepID=UPI002008859E|nr:heterokaryon incompatibility protein-domain-containing protein [Annulohypoxylon maeteangense]KAI0890186.1 heterokaryon incompatibility protein-domain-containing protein [Annulohypoxylon maeteangense]
MNTLQHNEIRILKILPGDASTPIKCELRVASLSKVSDFETVSYVWGDFTNLVDIELSGRKVGVTKNLHTLLHRLRLTSNARSVWIDQLCIDQKNKEEKSSQVRLMRQIYSRCSSGLIWFGELQDNLAPEDAAAVVDFFQYISAFLKTGSQEEHPKPTFTKSKALSMRFLAALRSMSYYECPWWLRIWTVQEAVLPRQSTVIWGPFEISWDIFLVGARTFTFTTFSELEIISRLRPEDQWSVFNIFRQVKGLANANNLKHDPISVMTRWRGRQATDPRDQVYALTGLNAPGLLPNSERCDYSIQTHEVYEIATKDLIRFYGNLLPISMNPRVAQSCATPGIPGWALDLDTHRNYWTSWTIDRNLYENSNANQGLTPSSINLDVEKILGLDGVFVDVVKIADYEEHWIKDTSAIAKIIRRWHSLTMENGDTMQSTRREDFGLLMLNNIIRERDWEVTSPVAPDDIEAVFEYLDTGEQNHTIESIVASTMQQSFFITETGLMGLGHLETQPGDEIWIFNMGKVPFSLRKHQNTQETTLDYDFFGPCYIQGIMQGEFLEGGKAKGKEKAIWIH